MAVLFCDGFDHYTIDSAFTNLLRKWTAASIGPASGSGFSAVTGRYGSGKAFHANQSNGGTLTIGVANVTTFIFGFAWSVNGTNNRQVVRFMDSGTQQVELAVLGSGAVQATRNSSTSLAISNGGLISQNAWNYFECKITINATTGLFEVRLNGNPTAIFSFTGNTKNSANSFINTIQFQFPDTTATQIDDVYFMDTTGSINTNYLGEQWIRTVMPSGAGFYAQWTPLAGSNWSEVSDNPPDDDTSYNSSSTVGQLDAHAHTALSLASGTVAAAVVNNQARKDDAATRQIAGLCHSSGTDGVAATATMTSAYMNYQGIFEADPNTGVAWASPTAVDNANFGYKEIA